MIKDIFPIDDTVSSGKVFFRWCFIVRAISSGGERHLDTVEVSGSKPLSPTIDHLVRSLFASGFFVVWGKNHQKGRKKAEIVLRKIPKETFKASYRMIKTRVTLSFDS